MADTGTWRPTAADPLLILAMDHRESLGKKVFGVVDDAPTPEQTRAIETAKQLTYAGLAAVRDQLPAGRAGVLVDERYGADVITSANHDGVVLAVPVEKSGREWFTLEYGADWAAHVRDADPAYVKVLVRDNPDFDDTHRKTQFADLAELSASLTSMGVPLLYELLVPGTDDQKASVGGDADAYDRDIRPELVIRVIADNQQAGIEPTIWKIEGLETTDAAHAIVGQIRSGGRDDIDAVVLGRDAPFERLDHWLSVAAGVDGFVGFAIGRSIWQDAVAANFRGEIDEAAAIGQISANYLHFAMQYTAAR
jgi:myo-inositol catabolism protein IolC